MPIYEYQCDACQHAFDALQKMSDDILTECPECGELRLRKLISAPNFRLKGAGWYETDFKDKNQRNLADGADTAGGSDTAGGDTKAASKDGETKAADKTAKKSTDGTGDNAAKAKPVSKSGGSASSE
jgi:putative FmdB family regulatory protein